MNQYGSLTTLKEIDMALYIVEVPDKLEQAEGLKPGAVPRMLATFVNSMDTDDEGNKPEDERVRVFQPSYKLKDVLQNKIGDGSAMLLPDLTDGEFDEVMSADNPLTK